jgi:hypothetical protein
MQIITLEINTKLNQQAWQMMNRLIISHDKVASFTVKDNPRLGFMNFIVILRDLNELDLRVLSKEFQLICTGEQTKR